MSTSDRPLPASPSRPTRTPGLPILRRAWLVIVAVLMVAMVTPDTAYASTAQKLFIIHRSKNADEAHYDVRLNADGSLDGRYTVDGYFMNKGPDGNFTRANFTVFQKMAYGWDTEPTGNGTYALKLRAFKDRPMWIVKINGRWRLQTTIAGKQAYMNSLYVKTNESGLIPSVVYVDVFGDDAATGAALTEHIVK